MLNKVKDVVDYLESDKVPFIYVVMTFLSASVLRTFLEQAMLFDDAILSNPWMTLCHYIFWYIALALALVIVLSLVLREAPLRVARVVAVSFIILNIVPLIDGGFGFVKNYHIGYLYPELGSNVWMLFLTFFGRLEFVGATPGMRIEIALVILASMAYVFVKKRVVGTSLLAGFLVYCVIFINIAMPFFLKFAFNVLNWQGIIWSQGLMIRFYGALMVVFGAIIFYMAQPGFFKVLIKDIRLTRLLHYLILVVLGALFYVRHVSSAVTFGPEEAFRAFFLAVSITFAWIFSVISNNWADVDIDRVSNPTRPLITGDIPEAVYRRIGWGCLATSLLYGALAGIQFMEVTVLFMANYFLYSMPPLRLKCIPILSKVIIGFNAGLMFLVGHMFFADSIAMPPGLIVFFLVFMSAAANVIDLKDEEGDRSVGIRTLATLIGSLWAKRIIGGVFILTYQVAYYGFSLKGFFWVCVGLGLLQYFLITRKDYDERPVMLVHVISLLLIAVYMAFVR